MSDTKRDQLRSMVRRRAGAAIAGRVATMSDRAAAEAIRQNIDQIASSIAFEIADEYPFLELADIMEWKRTRVRR